MRVRIYRNLHKDLFSVLWKGKVVMHTEQICLKNCRFIVRKSGWLRTIKEKRKNVHAFIEGDLDLNWVDSSNMTLTTWPDLCFNWAKVNYNPYIKAHFTREDSGNVVSKASKVKCHSGQVVWAENPEM